MLNPYSLHHLPLHSIGGIFLENFRNYTNLRLSPAKINIVTGENGAGKTNLLEAISFLAPGRGLRGAALEEITYHNTMNKKKHWTVRGHIRTDLGMIPLHVQYGSSQMGKEETYMEDAKPSSRHIYVDGKRQRNISSLGQYVRMHWLTPAMDRLFMAPASDRRRFLDQLTVNFNPDHSLYTQRFERLMRERNRILQRSSIDEVWITEIEKQMAQIAITIGAARKATLSKIALFLGKSQEIHAEIGFPHCDLELQCRIGNLLDTHTALDAEDIYASKLCSSRHEDRLSGRTLHGPHRADFIACHGDAHILARNCSTGEQKAMLTTIILAALRAGHAIYGYAPILLLDEITAHFDAKKRRILLEYLIRLDAQIWMTGTEADLFSSLKDKAEFFHIENNQITS